MQNWKWRPYQNDCFKSIIDKYQKGITQQLVVQATGLGKRSCSIYMAGKAPNSLFLAHTEELIEQAYNEFVDRYGYMNVGMIRGSRMDLDKRFVVSSPQTLHNRLDKIPRNTFYMIQIDETHLYMAKTWFKVINHFDCKIRLGWTATPRRLDGLSLMDLYQEKTFEFGILRGIEQGYLAELKGIRVATNINISGVGKSMGDFKTGELESLVDIPERNKLIVDSYEKYALERQFICFAVDTHHIVNITETFTQRGYNVAAISSDVAVCPDREGTISAFKRGEITGLINCQILTMGFDYSEVGAILDAAPTMSESRYLQRIGRGTRIKSTEFQAQFGNNCIVIDFVDLSSRHHLVNSFELDKSLPALAKVFVTKEDRLKLFDAEKQRREAKVVHVTEKDEYFDFTKPPKVKISGSDKMMEQATPAQINMISKFGLYTKFDEEGNEIEYTKKNIAELLETEILPWMKKKMVNWKYNPNGATIAQFLAISKDLRLKEEEYQRDLEREVNTKAMLAQELAKTSFDNDRPKYDKMRSEHLTQDELDKFIPVDPMDISSDLPF